MNGLYTPRGRDPLEDLNLLADCIAGSDAELFAQEGGAIWITAGRCMSINPDVLRTICTTFITTKRPKESSDGWIVEYLPYEPTEATLRTLLTARTREDGGLAQRLPKMPSEPLRLTLQQAREVRARLGIGEQPDAIARAYGVEVEAIIGR